MRILLSCLAALVLVLAPSWLAKGISLVVPSFTAQGLAWNPLAIAASWVTAVPNLFAYSASFALGALCSLAFCLYWFVRTPNLLFGLLLLGAAFMAGPTWPIVASLWVSF